MTTILSLDPGKVTGVAFGYFDAESPLTFDSDETLGARVLFGPSDMDLFLRSSHEDITVAERFVLNSGNEYTADLSGVRVEGVIEVHRPETIWRFRSDKAQVPDELLKKHGLWVTGADVEWEDGRDANDAIIHALGHVAFTLGHRPTLRKYFK